MDVTNPRSHPLLELGLSKKAIAELSDEEVVSIVVLLGVHFEHFKYSNQYAAFYHSYNYAFGSSMAGASRVLLEQNIIPNPAG